MIQSSKQQTFKVKAELLTGNPTVYRLIIEGFNLNEEYDLCTIINQIVRDLNCVYKPDHLMVVHLEDKDQIGGVSYIRLTLKTGDSITLKLNWGEAILEEPI